LPHSSASGALGKPPPSAAEELLLPEASECEDPDEPATVHSLAEELLLLVLVHARFSSLLALKLVNHQFASLARRSLSEHTEWAVARALCANQQILHLMSGRETDAYEKSLGRGFLTALRKDDTRTVDALLTLRFFRVESPVFCAGDAINRYVATPLHLAHSAEMVSLLCRHGASVDARRGGTRTPLMDACAAGEPAVVRALIAAGASAILNLQGQSTCASIALSIAQGAYPSNDASSGPGQDLPWRGEPPADPDYAGCAKVLREWSAAAAVLSPSGSDANRNRAPWNQ